MDQKTSTSTLLVKCDADTQRQCLDGSCILRTELCQEETMNQDTILIMVGVGVGVVLFLVLLYCLQQRRNAHADQQAVNIDDVDSPELLMPPPTYDEAVNIHLYPPTPQMQRIIRIPSTEEPVTPPPNYDTALHILAQSQENLCSAAKSKQLLRRAISVEHVGINRGRPMTFSSFGANNKTYVIKNVGNKSGATNT